MGWMDRHGCGGICTFFFIFRGGGLGGDRVGG